MIFRRILVIAVVVAVFYLLGLGIAQGDWGEALKLAGVYVGTALVVAGVGWGLIALWYKE